MGTTTTPKNDDAARRKLELSSTYGKPYADTDSLRIKDSDLTPEAQGFLAKYADDLAADYARRVASIWEGQANSSVVLEVAEDAYRAGYTRAREDFGK